MLKYLKKYRMSYFVATAGVIIFGVIAIKTDVFQECMNRSNYESSDYEPPKGLGVVISQLGWAKTCAGEFLIKDGEAITAFFTLILALTTVGLWRSTQHLWEVARESAQALPIIEGAYVYPVIIEENIGAFAASAKLGTPKPPPGSTQGHEMFVKFIFKNFGRTPAVISGYRVRIIHTAVVRADDAEVKITKVVTLGAGNRTEELTASIKEAPIDELKPFIEGKSEVSFMGYVAYTDIFGESWAFPFDWTYSEAQGRFKPDNQRRRKPKKYVLVAKPGKYAIGGKTQKNA